MGIGAFTAKFPFAIVSRGSNYHNMETVPANSHGADQAVRSSRAVADNRIALGSNPDAALHALDIVLSAGGMGLAVVDREYRFTYANEWLGAANGLPPSEMVGRPVVEIVGAGYWERLKPFVDDALAGKATLDSPITRESRRAPGAMRTALLSYFPVESGNLTPTRIESIVVVVKDVTEQMRAENVLRQSEIHARKIAESAQEQARFERMQRFMAQMSEQMHSAPSSDDVLWRVVNLLGKYLKVDRCAYGEIDPSTSQVTIHRDYCHRVPSLAGTYKRISFGPLVTAELSSGKTVVLASTQTDPRTTDVYDAVYKPLRIAAAINVPIMKGGRQVATLAVQQGTPRDWTAEEIALVETVGDGTWLSVENARLTRETQQAEARQRIFLRDILASVTEGRLHLCQSADELPKYLGVRGVELPLSHDDDIAPIRHAARAIADSLGFPTFRTVDIVTATGEAAMNAVVHAARGRARVCSDGKDTVQVWIEDNGGGISVENLPNATLTLGYSTSHTLGHGFKIMLHTADRVYLLTGASGTTVVIEQDRKEPEPNW